MFGTVRGAFIFTGVVIFISFILDFIIGIKERCGKTSSMTYEVQSEVNRGYIDKEDIQTDSEANKSASFEQCSHL
jgi:hypothetical protein